MLLCYATLWGGVRAAYACMYACIRSVRMHVCMHACHDVDDDDVDDDDVDDHDDDQNPWSSKSQFCKKCTFVKIQ